MSRWADAAMFRAEPMPEGNGPQVYILNATPDPLGSLAALCEIYQGRVVRSLSEVDDKQRRYWLEEVTKSPLQGPLESITFHFLIERVTRAFTHQMVRGRHAFYAQESMRFAVVDEERWGERVAYPPSLAAEPEPYPAWDALNDNEKQYILARDAWDDAVITSQLAYNRLIEAGIPAEDARGLMPHAMTTRLHWVVSLRELLHVAGLRLCTQAQFEWRLVMAQLVNALRQYGTDNTRGAYRRPDQVDGTIRPSHDGWQFALVADLLRPVCYQEGRCTFMAKDDRACAIRERVNANARAGRPSSEWHEPYITGALDIGSISPYEWAADPSAARKR
jgi:flavin-dependent thymidylate synthase